MVFKRAKVTVADLDIGDIQSPSTKACYERFDQFLPMPKPKQGDWLATRTELGQSVKSFNKMSFRAIPHGSYRTIYVNTLGSFEGPRCPSLDAIESYLSAFFLGLDVHFLPQVSVEAAGKHLGRALNSRANDYTHQKQLYTDDILEWMSSWKKEAPSSNNNKMRACGANKSSSKSRVAASRDRNRRELVNISLTMLDVTPGDDWNFVFGIARPMDGVGVWSLARMDTAFPAAPNCAPTDADAKIILARSFRVITHEICHLFGLKHCIYFSCLMNGCNNAEEMDATPLWLCPVCLRKLHQSLKFDPVERYNALAKVCSSVGLDRESEWLSQWCAGEASASSTVNHWRTSQVDEGA